ncbi:MAG: hypothetical protein ACRDHG_10365 [Anaerolineales bacterium]
MAALKASKQAHRVELARLEAERGLMRAAESDRPGSGKLPAEAWGLVVERQADLALSGGGDSTKAARFVGETVGLVHPREGAGVQAVQLNVTIAADLADRYQATVIDVEIPADGEGSEPMPEGGPVLDALEVEPVEPEGGW